MSELAKLNRGRSSASDAMVLFLAINTSAITLLPPTGTMMVRAAADSQNPEAIWIPTLIATSCSTLAAVAMVYLLRRLSVFRPRPEEEHPLHEDSVAELPELSEGDDLSLSPSEVPRQPIGPWRWLLLIAVSVLLGVALLREGLRLVADKGAADGLMDLLQVWSFPLLIAALLLIGIAGRVDVYDSMIKGAKEGLDVAVRIVPYLVAIIAAVAMFRASGLLDLMIEIARPVTRTAGVPPEVLPMAILRPLSGSGSFAVMSETLTTYGPDSFIGLLASTLQGSTETTFYVLAVYFGAGRVTRGRHTLAACLTGDLAGFAGAVAACHLFFG